MKYDVFAAEKIAQMQTNHFHGYPKDRLVVFNEFDFEDIANGNFYANSTSSVNKYI